MNMIDDPTNRKYGTHKEFLIKFVNVISYNVLQKKKNINITQANSSISIVNNHTNSNIIGRASHSFTMV